VFAPGEMGVRIAWVGLSVILGLMGPAHAHAAAECGRASWYELRSKTASGERADPESFAAAHRTLPFGTLVRVENLSNNRAVLVRINDRGPFVRGRIIDVTRAAARALGMVNAGSARVRIVAGIFGKTRC
jgi:rare lipoprotein A